MVGIVCAALVLIHLLVGLIAHKLDHLDSLRLSQVPLCGRPGLYQYRVLVKTGWRRGAGQREGQATDVEILSEDKKYKSYMYCSVYINDISNCLKWLSMSRCDQEPQHMLASVYME